MKTEFGEQEKQYEEQRRRHIAQHQRVKKEERKAAAEAQQQELYVFLSLTPHWYTSIYNFFSVCAQVMSVNFLFCFQMIIAIFFAEKYAYFGLHARCNYILTPYSLLTPV